MKSTEMWAKAKKLIPGGSQLFSKRAELYAPNQWPSYSPKAKGVTIWDLDGNEYTDMSTMGIGACVLGYAYERVDKAVKDAIDRASMTSLNCPEEIELSEVLLKLHPWAGMIRYARSGGEAMAIAVRIGHAFSGKDKVAFCGYHGWHDWYLAANLARDHNLDGHLLPGLKPKGVPRALRGSALPFAYNHPEELEKIMSENDEIGVVVMEPVRHEEPKEDFLNKVAKMAGRAGAVVIFDEITSGWRMRVGGVHELYGARPDLVVYAKAMSNGYPMATVVGDGEVMDAAQNTFISSTAWTERIGPVASIATIGEMTDRNVPGHLQKIGRLISKGWLEAAKHHDLKIHVGGLPPLTTFNFEEKESQALSTLFTQEMLSRGFLASRNVYVSFSHNESDVSKYLEAVDEVFETLSKAKKS